MSSFTLLDDNQATDAEPSSRLYTDFERELSCAHAAQFADMLEQMQSALQQGLYAVAAFSYELGAQVVGIAAVAELTEFTPSRILLYKSMQRLSSVQVTEWLQQQTLADPIAGIANLQASVNQEQFTEAIERIRDYIVAGDIYQVNYTLRLYFQTYGTLCGLYQRLRERQSVPYGALIALPDGSAFLSLSPELFIRHQQGQLSAQPMKGTAAASMSENEALNKKVNLQRSVELSVDMKNRAENLMIVDLLRNDLSRIAQLGSVSVPQLFDVRRFNSVLQMTSSVQARLRADVSLPELLTAIYPCGSITGAPKHRSMQIIAELEQQARGIYTGAIGWFDPLPLASPTQQTIPDFCLSVPIRTLHLNAPSANGTRTGVMGVGAGIVFDSLAKDEYQECQLKAGFLTGLPAQFGLFETMYASRQEGCRYLERHLSRLSGSAGYFGIPVNLSEIRQQLVEVCAALPDDGAYRIKLTLSATQSGLGQIQHARLVPLTSPVRVLMATIVQEADALWLQHKSTQREVYDQAWQQAERLGAFDMLFSNRDGEITEGGRSNLLFKIAGCWYTPPLAAGVLPGVMRAVLMDDPSWSVTERSITVQQLKNVEEIALCNALRGVVPAQLVL